MSPLVSIILSVFNGGNTLSLAIQSVLLQNYEYWELIILDDASIDNSLEVIHRFHDDRISVIAGERNIGLAARLNMGIDAAQGKYIARMDQDDICFPDRLLKQVQFMETHQDVDLLGSSVVVFKENGIALGRLPVKSRHEEICLRPWSGFYMPHPTWMGETEWFRKHRYDSSADGAEDQHLLFRSYRNSRFSCLDEPLLGYRESRSLKKFLRTRFVFLKSLGREAIRMGQFITATKILVIQSLRAGGDILNITTGIAGTRSPLSPLDTETQGVWGSLWERLDKDPSYRLN